MYSIAMVSTNKVGIPKDAVFFGFKYELHKVITFYGHRLDNLDRVNKDWFEV